MNKKILLCTVSSCDSIVVQNIIACTEFGITAFQRDIHKKKKEKLQQQTRELLLFTYSLPSLYKIGWLKWGKGC